MSKILVLFHVYRDFLKFNFLFFLEFFKYNSAIL